MELYLTWPSICNINRNIFGMIPHQERAANTNLSSKDRKFLFVSLLKNLKLTKHTCFLFFRLEIYQ